MATALLSLFGGLLLLVIAADWLVDGAVGLSRRLGISMVVVGLTVVAYGTSFPEFVVSLISASKGVSDFAIGNIVGSNVANIGLVLGATALVRPFQVTSRELFRRDMPILSTTTALAMVFFLSGEVGHVEGGLLLAIAVGFTILSLRKGGEELDEADAAEELEPWTKSVFLIAVGASGLVIGAHFMVEGGTFVARAYGISERVIGLTIVAVGTSLPELAASVAGALKGHPGLAVGNVVGSCLFNLTFVLGASASITPMTTNADAMIWDLATMGGLTLLMWMVLATGRRLTRTEGAGLVTVYVGYLTYLVITTLTGTAG